MLKYIKRQPQHKPFHPQPPDEEEEDEEEGGGRRRRETEENQTTLSFFPSLLFLCRYLPSSSSLKKRREKIHNVLYFRRKAMAGNLTSAKAVVSSLANKLSAVAVSRRGFAAATGGVSGGGGGGGFGAGMSTVGMMRKMDLTAGKLRESSWGPDPVTGYYRPGDRAVEIDAAELRATLLNPRGKN